MQNPYSKLNLAIKTLIFDRFSNSLQVLLRQIEMLNRKYFPCLLGVKNSRQKCIIRGQFTISSGLHRTIIISFSFCTKFHTKFHTKFVLWNITMITHPCYLDPYELHFSIVKLGFTRVNLIVSYCCPNHRF